MTSTLSIVEDNLLVRLQRVLHTSVTYECEWRLQAHSRMRASCTHSSGRSDFETRSHTGIHDASAAGHHTGHESVHTPARTDQ